MSYAVKEVERKHVCVPVALCACVCVSHVYRNCACVFVHPRPEFSGAVDHVCTLFSQAFQVPDLCPPGTVWRPWVEALLVCADHVGASAVVAHCVQVGDFVSNSIQ